MKKNKPGGKFNTYQGAKHGLHDNVKNTFYITTYEKGKPIKQIISMYEYECYIENNIKRLKAKIGSIIFKQNRLTEKLNRLKDQKTKILAPKKICYGSKAYFKKLNTTDISYEDWKAQFNYKRSHSFTISGRKDARFGNFVFHYDPVNNKMLYKSINGGDIVLDVKFQYGQEYLDNEIINHDRYKRPIAYTLTKHYDKENKLYFTINAIITLPEKKHVNSYTGDGVVSIDVNVNRIDCTVLNKDGCLIDKHVFKFNTYDKTTNQISHIFNNISKELIDICVKNNKPLVMENLNTEDSKRKLLYGNKKRNKAFSMFAYNKITESINSRAYKKDVYVYRVNPAYTSQIAKFKYMRKMGCEIHTAAALVIGRRGMGLKEHIPKIYRLLVNNILSTDNNWKLYATIKKATNKIPIKEFKNKIADINLIIKEYDKKYVTV